MPTSKARTVQVEVIVTIANIPKEIKIMGVDGLLRKIGNRLPAWKNQEGKNVAARFGQGNSTASLLPRGYVDQIDRYADNNSRVVQVKIQHDDEEIVGSRRNAYENWAREFYVELRKVFPETTVEVAEKKLIGHHLNDESTRQIGYETIE